jgi:hypothetical protein
MNPNQALQQLQESMVQHGLSDWSAALDTAVRRFGVCHYGKKHIGLSRKLCELNSDEEVTDTILHEIAHALAFERHGVNCGHDQRWKAICVEIGARPKACYDNTVVQPDAPWVLVHKTTGEVFRGYYKKPRKDWSRVWIRGRKQETFGQLTVRANSNQQANEKSQTHGNNDAVTGFTPESVLELQQQISSMVKDFAESRGMQLDNAKSRYNTQQCDLTLSFTVPENETSKVCEREEFEALAPLFDLQGSDYRKTFTMNGRRFTLVALKPNNRKYPIIGADDTGRRYKFTVDVITQLQAG